MCACFFFLKIYLFIRLCWVFFTALGLSLVAEHGLWGEQASVVALHTLSSCGTGT